jgi:hypothetical protein
LWGCAMQYCRWISLFQQNSCLHLHGSGELGKDMIRLYRQVAKKVCTQIHTQEGEGRESLVQTTQTEDLGGWLFPILYLQIWLTTFFPTCPYNLTISSPNLPLPWRWRQNVLLKQWYPPTILHDATTPQPTRPQSQKNTEVWDNLIMFTAR